MARIRSIKPEFPQSETVGSLSRDARLLFIQLWTLADDSGRSRASSRVLASLLYPFDDDAKDLIGAWLDELEAKGCIRRYAMDGNSYLDIPNWLKHQKIDHPGRSHIPEFSRALASPRETLAPDLGPRIIGPRKDSELRSAPDVRTRLFSDGAQLLADQTGRTPDSCKSIIGRWLKLTDDEAVHVLAAIEDAHRNRVADPTAWITAALQGRRQPHAGYPQSNRQPNGITAAIDTLIDRLDGKAEARSVPREINPRLLSDGGRK